jgi:hypothetical protein
MTEVETGSCSLFETPKLVLVLSFLLASSHEHSLMNFYHISLLLLVVLSAYSGSPQHAKPPDSPNLTRVMNNSSAQLGVLAPVLPQNEVCRIVLPKNGVFILPQNEVFMFTLPPSGVFKIVQLQNEVFKSVTAQSDVL